MKTLVKCTAGRVNEQHRIISLLSYPCPFSSHVVSPCHACDFALLVRKEQQQRTVRTVAIRNETTTTVVIVVGINEGWKNGSQNPLIHFSEGMGREHEDDFSEYREFCQNRRKMLYKSVSHVIFDLDGTILDSEVGLDKIISDIAEMFDKTYTHEARMKILGTPEKDTAKIAIKELKLPITIEEFVKIYREKVAKEMGNPPLIPGVEKLINHLYSNNVPIALATSSSDFTKEIKTRNYPNLFNKFNHEVMGSTDLEVKQGKPNPDIFLVCASRFPDNPKPSKCLVFEDAPNGVLAATKAGMQSVMIASKEIPQELRKLATIVVDSFDNFKPELFGLPPYNKIN
nr:pseudouridine-5'-phosphatase-like [Onthophagus taurus]